jgi:hypothetical protein
MWVFVLLSTVSLSHSKMYNILCESSFHYYRKYLRQSPCKEKRFIWFHFGGLSSHSVSPIASAYGKAAHRGGECTVEQCAHLMADGKQRQKETCALIPFKDTSPGT